MTFNSSVWRATFLNCLYFSVFFFCGSAFRELCRIRIRILSTGFPRCKIYLTWKLTWSLLDGLRYQEKTQLQPDQSIYKSIKESSFCHELKFSNPSIFATGFSLWNFDRIFDLSEFIVRNVKGLRHRVAEI